MKYFKDFKLETSKFLIESLLNSGYLFSTYENFETHKPEGKIIVLRHDIDRNPENSVKMARMESEIGICASYYFGFFNNSFNEKAILKIKEMGHEIGYHYNDLAYANGDFKKALNSFTRNLDLLRKYYPVKTMCMHGSPLSKWDNRMLWAKYNFSDYGIVSEPYLDLNFDEVLYLTDSSRSWNNPKVTIRDKVVSNFNFRIQNTYSIINLLKNNQLPDKILINMHPHNWSDNFMEWSKILFWQSIKNVIKFLVNKILLK